MDNLTGKQRAFVYAYIETLNASEAARRAGYADGTEGVRGSENLRKPAIRTAIDRLMRDQAMTAEETIYRLSQHARSNVGDAVAVRPGGEIVFDIDALRLALKEGRIKSIRETKDGLQVEFHDSQSALNTLAKIHQLLTTNIELSWQTKAEQAGIDPDDLIDQLAEIIDPD